MIRSRATPAGWEEEAATQVKSAGALLDEGDTVLRKASFDESPRGTRSPAPVAEHTSSGQTNGGLTGSGRRKKKRAGPWWAPWAAAGVGLGLGVGVGVVLSSVAAGASLIASWGLGGPSTPPPKAPTIEVMAPTGTQILLDGEAVGRSITVEPDKVHRLQVDLKGRESWSQDVMLGFGETRVYVVTPVDLKPIR